MLNQLKISELAAKLAKREVSARETMQACVDQIARVDGQTPTRSRRRTRRTRPSPPA